MFLGNRRTSPSDSFNATISGGCDCDGGNCRRDGNKNNTTKTLFRVVVVVVVTSAVVILSQILLVISGNQQSPNPRIVSLKNVATAAATTTAVPDPPPRNSNNNSYPLYCDCQNKGENTSTITSAEEQWGFLPRPALHEIIADFNSNVRTNSNVSWLLDFAIIGFPKCATTEHMNWLRQHNEVIMESKEIGFLQNDKPARMISHLYALPNIPGMRGYKSPKDIRSFVALQHVHTYWPTAKLMVGVRHPVRWYESLYNHFTRNGHPEHLPVYDASGHATKTTDLITRGQFHIHLSKLGKTNVEDPEEKALLGHGVEIPPYGRMNNKVFLYEVSQPFDSRNDRNIQYRLDLQEFLGVSSPLDPVHIAIDRTESENYHFAMDICEDKFSSLRQELVDLGTAASKWILHYFIVDADVTVSSPDHFKQLLQTWSIDPCIEGKNNNTPHY